MEYNVADLKENVFNKKVYGEEELPEEFLYSIKVKGILEPLAIKHEGTIISGHRRWRAAKQLNIETVPVRVVSYNSELDEREAIITFNNQREKTFSQKMREGEELKDIESERAKQRQSHGQTAPGKNAGGNISTSDQGKTRDNVAKQVGIGSGRTYDKAEKVWERAKQGDEAAVKTVEQLDEGATTIHAAHKKLNHKPAVEAPEMPEGKYNIILADPPWRYEFSETNMRAIENQYPTMDLEDIKGLQVPADDNAVLLLWATAPKLEEAIQVMRAWGFKYKTCAVWDKEKIGMGYWFRGQHELLLLGVKGSMSAPQPENRYSSVIQSPRSKHSAKPETIYNMIEAMFPHGHYIELFARTQREGWGRWGNEGK